MPTMIDWGSLTLMQNIEDKSEYNEAEKHDIKLLESRKNIQSIRGSVMVRTYRHETNYRVRLTVGLSKRDADGLEEVAGRSGSSLAQFVWEFVGSANPAGLESRVPLGN